MTDYLYIPLASIEVGSDRARAIDPAWVEGLAGSIREQGLLQPVVVRQTEGGYRLVAGHHRVEAFRLLERERIPAILSDATSDDEARLAEVMENLGRHDLIALDRCHHLFELKQVWERLHPDFANGGGQTLPTGGETAEIFGFASSVSEKIGLAKRTINHAVKIWTGLVPTVRGRLAGTDLAHKQTELKALSELPATRQIKVLDAILSADLPEVGNVAQALAYLAEGTVPDGFEKRFQTLTRSLGALDDVQLDSVIDACEARIIDSLKRRGRI